jgi:hypothetical protein
MGTPAAANTIVEVPIEKDAEAIFIHASVDTFAGNEDDERKPWTFLLDTGASHCFIDESHRASLGVSLGTVENLSAADGSRVETFAPADLHVGDHTLRPRRRFVCVDLKRMSRIIGEPLDGVLGMDALRHSVVDIDFIECRLRFQSAAPRDDDHRIPLVWKLGRRPFVEGAFCDGTKLDLLVDTGCLADFAGTVRPDVFENLCKAHSLTPLDPAGRSKFATFTGTMMCRFGRASSFSVGRHTHTDLVFDTDPGGNSLSLGYLSRYRVTFDFPNSAMYLWPSTRFLKEDEYRDFTSFLVSRREGRVIVFKIVKPAAEGHVRIGDELIAINGEPVSQMSTVGMRRKLGLEPLQRLELRRDGVVREENLNFRGQMNGGM